MTTFESLDGEQQSEPLPAPPGRGGHARLFLALRLMVIAVVIVAFVYFLRNLRLAQLWAALRGAHVLPLLFAIVLPFLNLGGKAMCWRAMLARHSEVSLRLLFRYTVAAFAVSAMTPARGGEFLRLWLLKRRNGVPVPVSAAVAIAEKVLDGVAMIFLLAPLPWLLPGLPPWVERATLALSAVGLALAGGCWLAAGRSDTRGLLGRFAAGFQAMRDPRAMSLSLTSLVLAWLADLALVWVVLWSLGIDVPLAAGPLILLTVNLAILVPSTPGHMGTLELGAMVGLKVLGVAPEPALAFALLYHALQVVPLVLAAALDARLILAARRAVG